MNEGSAKKIKCMGGVSAKKIKCVGGGASEIFSSPSPPEDFKWNSPKARNGAVKAGPLVYSQVQAVFCLGLQDWGPWPLSWFELTFVKVCLKIKFYHLHGCNSTKYDRYPKNSFWLVIRHEFLTIQFSDLFDILMTLTSLFDLEACIDTFLAPNKYRSVKNNVRFDIF